MRHSKVFATSGMSSGLLLFSVFWECSLAERHPVSIGYRLTRQKMMFQPLRTRTFFWIIS